MSKTVKILILAVAALCVLGFLTSCSLANPQTATCLVTDKDRSSADGVSSFRIYTEGCGSELTTLKVADNMLKGKFNASDVYAKIKVGETYQFEISGVRNGLFSLIPEINSYQLVHKS